MSDTKIPEVSLSDWAKPEATSSAAPKKYTQITKSGRFSVLSEQQAKIQGKSSVLKVFKTVLSALSTEQNLTVSQLQNIRNKCSSMLERTERTSWKPLFLVRRQFKKLEEALIFKTVMQSLKEGKSVDFMTLEQDMAAPAKAGYFELSKPTIRVDIARDIDGKISGKITYSDESIPAEKGGKQAGKEGVTGLGEETAVIGSELQTKEIKLSEKDAEELFYKLFPEEKLTSLLVQQIKAPKKEKEIILDTIDKLRSLIESNFSTFAVSKRNAIHSDMRGEFDFSLGLSSGVKISFVKIEQEKHYTITPKGGTPIKIDQKEVAEAIDSLLFPDIDKTKEEILQKIKGRKGERYIDEPEGRVFKVKTDDGRTWGVYRTVELEDGKEKSYERFNSKVPCFRIAQLDDSGQECQEAFDRITSSFPFKYELWESHEINNLLKQS